MLLGDGFNAKQHGFNTKQHGTKQSKAFSLKSSYVLTPAAEQVLRRVDMGRGPRATRLARLSSNSRTCVTSATSMMLDKGISTKKNAR